MSGAVEANSRVTLHFRLWADGVPEVESTFGGEPLTFRMGDGTFLPALEGHLLGLRPGGRETFTLEPDTFGERDPAAIQSLPLADFGDVRPEPGMIFGFAAPGGEEIPGAVLEIAGDQVKIDFNHPLAGRTVRFEVEILESEKG